jgi:hypothetical protein
MRQLSSPLHSSADTGSSHAHPAHGSVVGSIPSASWVFFIARRLGLLFPIMTIRLGHACPPGRFEQLGLVQLVCQSAKACIFCGLWKQTNPVFGESRNSYLLDLLLGAYPTRAEKLPTRSRIHSTAMVRSISAFEPFPPRTMACIHPIKKFDWTRFAHSV